MSNATRFKITTQNGTVFTGPVRGMGGFVSDVGVLQRQQRLAETNRPLGIYEPAPGCVGVYPEYCCLYDGREVVVGIVGATIEVAPEKLSKESKREIADVLEEVAR